MPNGHVVRSQSEAALCDFLSEMTVAHMHWAVSFDVPVSAIQWRLFIPSILLTDLKCDDRVVIIEPVNSVQIGGGVRQLQSFRKRYAREYYVIVVTRRVLHRRIPESAYDALFHVEDFADLGAHLQTQGRSPAT
jgi:hypothetical protein